MSDDLVHECDLFLLSSDTAYSAELALAAFARFGKSNVDGWGIGWWNNNRARVLRSERPALDDGQLGNLSREFAIAIQAVSAPVLLGHLRLTSRGGTRVENNHPFRLNYLGYDWLLAHNGTAHNAERLIPRDQRILAESDGDSARVAEFLRHEMLAYMHASPKHSLISGVQHAFSQLLEQDSGRFNLLLSNGKVSFALLHWRDFYILQRAKSLGDALLVSTLKLTKDEDWLSIGRLANRRAKMLAFSGPTLLANLDI